VGSGPGRRSVVVVGRPDRSQPLEDRVRDQAVADDPVVVREAERERVGRVVESAERRLDVDHGDVARFAIIGVVLAMGLNAMEIADQVVNLAFGLTLGAVAVAAALMFGLGGREAAGRQTEHWFRKLRGE